MTKGKQDSQCLALLLSQILVSQMSNSVHTLSIGHRINATVSLDIQYFSVLFAAANLYLSVLLQNIHGVSLYHSALLQKFEFVPLCTSYICRLFVPLCTSANYHCNEFAFYAQTPLGGKVQFKKPLYFPQINHPSLVPDSSVCKQWL